MRKFWMTLVLLTVAVPLFGVGAATRQMTLATAGSSANPGYGGDFEVAWAAGTPTGWDGAVSTPDESNTVAKHGTLSCSIASGAQRLAYRTITGSPKTYYCRFYFSRNAAELFSADTGNCTIAQTGTNAYVNHVVVTIVKSAADTYVFNCTAKKDDLSSTAAIAVAYSGSGWVCLEYGLHIGDAGQNDGWVDMWVNGVSGGRITGVDNDTMVSTRMVITGLFTSNTGYYDCVEFDTGGYIGPLTWTSGIQELLTDAAGNDVTLPTATYTGNTAAIKLGAGYTLTGNGYTNTIIDQPDEVSTTGFVSATAGDTTLVVTSADVFLIGMDVLLNAYNAYDAPSSDMKTITGINYDTETLTFEAGIYRSYSDPGGGHTNEIANVFPAILLGYYPFDGLSAIIDGPKVSNLRVTGAGAGQTKRSWYQAGVLTFRCENYLVDVDVIDAVTEGICDTGGAVKPTTTGNAGIVIPHLIDGAGWRGLHLSTYTTLNTYRDGEIRNCGLDGIYLCASANQNWFYRLNVHDNGTLSTAGQMNGIGGIQSIIAVPPYGDSDNVFEECTVHDNAGHGVYGYYDSQMTNGNSILSCIIYGNSLNGIFLSGMDDSLIQNCMVYGNGGAGILIGDGTNASVATVANCTVTGSDIGLGEAGAATVTAINSILYGHTLSYDADPGCTITYSDVGGTGVFTGAGNINADPLFEATTYRLKQFISGEDVNSPCVDAGSAAASTLSVPHGMSLTQKISTMTTCDEPYLSPDEGTVDMGAHGWIALGGHTGEEHP